MSEKKECTQNYFDGMKMSKKQLSFIWLLAAGTLLEQIDLYNFAIIAPALQELWGLSVGDIGKINSFFAIGGLCGSICSAWIGDRFGRHRAMTLGLFLGGTAAILTALAPNYDILLLCRLFGGFGVTSAIVIEATYLAEMVPGEQRSKWQGIVGIIVLLSLPISIFIAKAILSTGLENWRYIELIPGLAIIIAILFLIKVPESPRWLVAHNKIDKAKVIFKNLTGEELIINEDSCVGESNNSSYIQTIKIMLSKNYLKRSIFIIAVGTILTNAGFMISQMLPSLLASEGLSVANASMVQQMLTLTMVFAPIYLIFFGEKGGRKIPYAVTMTIVSVSIFVISIVKADNLPILFIATAMAGWAMFTHNSFCAVYGAELFPTNIRIMVSGVLNIFNRGGTILTQGFLVSFLYGNFGFQGYYTIVAAIYLFMAIFILLIAPRTAGKSLEELND